MVVKWGLLSAGQIVHDFAKAIRLLPKEDHDIVAIGSRSKDKAQKLATEFKISKIYDSYEELVNDPEIDIIYVGTIHPHHHTCVLLSLNAGKRVLCEKPMCLTTVDVKECISLAKEKKLFFMEGYWSRFFPIYHRIRQAMESGLIGDIKVVQASFGAVFEEEKHASRLKKELGGGALYDIACYLVMFMSYVMNGQKPEKVSADGFRRESGIDDTSSLTMKYQSGVVGSLVTSISAPLSNCATIFGTKGNIRIPAFFWCPNKLEINGKVEEVPNLPATDDGFIFSHSSGFVYEIEHVGQCIAKGLTESPFMSLDESILISELLGEIDAQI